MKIKDFEKFGTGCVEYHVEDLFSGRMFKHTEFPPFWNIEKIAQEMKNICENAMKDELWTTQRKKPFTATTSDGFELKIITDPNPLIHNCTAIENTTNRHIVTAHPIYEVKK